MKSSNTCQLIGNIGSDLALATLPSGLKALSFSLATTLHFKNEHGDKAEKTEWHNVATYGNLSELVATHCVKGSKVLVSGSLRTRSWITKEEVKHYITEIIADEIIFMGAKKST